MSWVDIGGGIEVHTTCFQTYPCLHRIRVGGVEKMALANEIPHEGRMNDGKKMLIGHSIVTGEVHYSQFCNIFGCGGKLK